MQVGHDYWSTLEQVFTTSYRKIMMRQIPSYTEILAVNLIKLINIMTNYGK
jgi:hypothetical protein